MPRINRFDITFQADFAAKKKLEEEAALLKKKQEEEDAAFYKKMQALEEARKKQALKKVQNSRLRPGSKPPKSAPEYVPNDLPQWVEDGMYEERYNDSIGVWS